MNVEEMDKAIERLKKVTGKSMALPSVLDIAHAFMGNDSWTVPYFRDALVDVLRKARSRWWVNNTAKEDLAESDDGSLANMGVMRLPVDRDGEIIRIGDELCGYGYPDGGVYCQATDGHLILVGEKGSGYRDWLLWTPYECTHYHKPTVEDVLREFAKSILDTQVPGVRRTYDGTIAEYEKKLREVMDA